MAYKEFTIAGAANRVLINTRNVGAIVDEFGGLTRVVFTGGGEITINEDYTTVEQFLLEADTEDRS